MEGTKAMYRNLSGMSHMYMNSSNFKLFYEIFLIAYFAGNMSQY